MKGKPLPFIIAITALLLYSCDLSNGGQYPLSPQYKRFWAQNTVTNSYDEVLAELLYIGEKCIIWGETASGINQYDAYTMAHNYDTLIYPRMMETFGATLIEEGITRNPMELADFYGDGDGKLCILLLDIKDSYREGVLDAYVAGYFWSGNFYSNMRYSNLCDMIYIDINPGKISSMRINNTIAHEMQHLMNYAIGLHNGRYWMDLWINEGLSSAAEWAWREEHSQERIDWYNEDWYDEDQEDKGGRIGFGNNFFVWGNHTDEYPQAILDDYSTVYLFFQWLRLQAGSTSIYKQILYSTHSDYKAVTTAAAAIDPIYSNNWRLLLRDWLAANYINAPTGRYGYKGDTALGEIEAWNLQNGSGSYSLAPGEGIYTINTSMPNATQYINYAGLPARSSLEPPDDDSAAGSDRLLSYNIDTDIYAASSEAEPFSIETTGLGINTIFFQKPQFETSTGSRSLSEKKSLGPYPIGINDLPGQNRNDDE